MSLKNKFKTDSSLARDGVWFDLAENSDGSKARIRLRRHGRSNRDWVTSFRKHTADKDMETITPEEDEKITAVVFVESCFMEWENVQPEDDGIVLPSTADAALALFSDPDWNDLLKECQGFSQQRVAFQKKKQEGEAKN